MLGSLRQGIAVEDSTQLLIAGVVGVALGVSFAYFPATYVAISIVAFFIVILAIRSPQYVLVALLFLQSTFLTEASLPKLGVGGINIWITDMIIIGLFGLIAIRLLVDRSYRMLHSPITVPLVLFLIWALLTALRGYFYRGNIRGDVVIETRTVLYFAIALCTIYLIRFEKDIKFILSWFNILALTAAIFILVQYALGAEVTLLTSGKIYTITTTSGEAVTRVQSTIGEGLVTFALIIKTIILLIDRLHIRKSFDVVQWLILTASLATSFNRTNWIMVLVSVLIAVFMIGGKGRRRLLLWSMVLLSLLIILGVFIVTVMPDSSAATLIVAGLERFGSIFQQASYFDPKESTIIWRNFEYKYGLPQIADNPIAGIGLGGLYRPTLSVDYPGFSGERYSHNANLWIAMKTGLVGFSLYLWFMLAFVAHAFKFWKRIPSAPQRYFVLGSGLAVLVSLFGQNLHPLSLMIGWVPVFAIAIGLSESIILNFLAKTEA
jgi:O-antigen ligase